MKPEDQAFPSFGVIHWNKEKQQFEAFNPMPGMSKRLYVATHVMAGIAAAFPRTVSDKDITPDTIERLSRLAFNLADTLMAEGNKTIPHLSGSVGRQTDNCTYAPGLDLPNVTSSALANDLQPRSTDL